jgi:hypothetical protein
MTTAVALPVDESKVGRGSGIRGGGNYITYFISTD